VPEKINPEEEKDDETTAKKLGKLAAKGVVTGIKAGVTTTKAIKHAIDENKETKESSKPLDRMSVKNERVEKQEKKEQKVHTHKQRNQTFNFSKSIDNSIDRKIYNSYNFLISMIIYLMIIAITNIIVNIDASYNLLWYAVLIFFPIFIIWRLKVMMPWLSITQFIKHIFRASKRFMNEMWKISPFGTLLLFTFLLILIYVVIANFVL
jgi:hypothetical protein